MESQAIKADNGKPRLTLMPSKIIHDIARVREHGVAKYGDSENWKADCRTYGTLLVILLSYVNWRVRND